MSYLEQVLKMMVKMVQKFAKGGKELLESVAKRPTGPLKEKSPKNGDAIENALNMLLLERPIGTIRH